MPRAALAHQGGNRPGDHGSEPGEHVRGEERQEHGRGRAHLVAENAGGRRPLALVGGDADHETPGGKVTQLTHDQSYVQLLVDMGAMTPEQAEHSPAKNVILQVMGQGAELRVDVGSLEVRPGVTALGVTPLWRPALAAEDIRHQHASVAK